MSRRYFEHLYTEISVAAGRRVSRYALWTRIWEAGADPEDLTRDHVLAFVDRELGRFLHEEGVALGRRARRHLERTLLRFDAARPTPEEWMARSAGVLST